jgi:hypothetical protein
MKKTVLTTIFLLCMVAQGVNAQNWTDVATPEALNSAIGTTAGTKYIRLTADIALSAYLRIGQNNVSQTVTIDLNGHTLQRTGLTKADANGHVIEVFGAGNLTLTSSKTGGKLTGGWANNGGGICNYGTLTIENNVTITGCQANEGGGIKNNTGATLTINGGVTITGNTSTA